MDPALFFIGLGVLLSPIVLLILVHLFNTMGTGW